MATRRAAPTNLPKNTICLWYDGGAEEAAQFYAAVFPDSRLEAVHRAPADFPGGKAGQVLTVEFTVCGIPCLGLNGGPLFRHSPAFSFQICTEDQEETDRYWNALVGNGGQEGECGWCQDRWGVHWQITPRTLIEALTAGGEEARRAFEAMMTMRKIDVAAIDAARRGESPGTKPPQEPSTAARSAITIEAHVPVPPAVAWEHFTTPQAITQWNQASPDWHCPWAEVDLRPGGRHVARMEARDGSFGFDFGGVYEEVDAPRALTLRLGDGRKVRTTFELVGSGTRVRTVFDAEGTHSLEQQRAGWQAILDSYASYVARSVQGG